MKSLVSFALNPERIDEQLTLIEIMLTSHDENIKSLLEETLLATKLVHGDEIKERMKRYKKFFTDQEEVKNRHFDMYAAQLKVLLNHFQHCVHAGKMQKLVMGVKHQCNPGKIEQDAFDSIIDLMDRFTESLKKDD